MGNTVGAIGNALRPREGMGLPGGLPGAELGGMPPPNPNAGILSNALSGMAAPFTARLGGAAGSMKPGIPPPIMGMGAPTISGPVTATPEPPPNTGGIVGNALNPRIRNARMREAKKPRNPKNQGFRPPFDTTRNMLG